MIGYGVYEATERKVAHCEYCGVDLYKDKAIGWSDNYESLYCMHCYHNTFPEEGQTGKRLTNIIERKG